MYYGLIRIIATVILFLLLTLFLKHFKKKVNAVLGVLIAVTISLALWYYPVENLFFLSTHLNHFSSMPVKER